MPGKTTYLGLNTALHDDIVDHETHLNENWNKIDETLNLLDGLAVNITKFGASTALVDNADAIQQAINYVSERGGGTVFIPSGTFYVVGKEFKTITLRDNVTIKGNGIDASTIKIHGSTGNWGTLFSHNSTIHKNIQLRDLTLDCNLENSVTNNFDNLSDHNKGRILLQLGGVYNAVVDNVKMISNGRWAIRFMGNNCKVVNSEFKVDISTVPVENSAFLDTSTIWFAGEYNIIHNNYMYVTGDYTTLQEPVTAIEFQGHYNQVYSNTLSGFLTGVIHTTHTMTTGGYSYALGYKIEGRGAFKNRISNNTIKSIYRGVQLWTFDNDTSSVLEGCAIHDNIIQLTNTTYRAGYTYGIGFLMSTSYEAKVKNLYIYNNQISFDVRYIETNTPTGDNGVKLYANRDMENVHVFNNTIRNCGGTAVGLFMEGTQGFFRNVHVKGNEFNECALPIRYTRGIEGLVITQNTFIQKELYAVYSDNMRWTIYSDNKTYTENKDITVLDNYLKVPSTLKPFYPEYDLNLINASTYPISRGMRVKYNNPNDPRNVVNENPVTPVKVPKEFYLIKRDGLLYKTRSATMSVTGTLKTSSGSAVTVTGFSTQNVCTVNDGTNVEPCHMFSVDSGIFQLGGQVCEYVVGNYVAMGGIGFATVSGHTRDEFIGRELVFRSLFDQVT